MHKLYLSPAPTTVVYFRLANIPSTVVLQLLPLLNCGSAYTTCKSNVSRTTPHAMRRQKPCYHILVRSLDLVFAAWSSWLFQIGESNAAVIGSAIENNQVKIYIHLYIYILYMYIPLDLDVCLYMDDSHGSSDSVFRFGLLYNTSLCRITNNCRTGTRT